MIISKKAVLPLIMGIITLLIGFCSCQKSPINGKLDGQWQVMTVEPEPPEILLKNRLYYCFNLHICQLTTYGDGAVATGNMIYDQDTQTLEVSFPNISTPREIALLKQYGIYENPVTFIIEHLDSKTLKMRDGETVVTLRKF